MFHLRTNDVKVPLRNAWIIIPKTDNTTLHKIWLKLCNCVHNDLIKNVSYKIIKNDSKNNENALIMNLLKYSMKTELLPLD
jgi:hypothetical protein